MLQVACALQNASDCDLLGRLATLHNSGFCSMDVQSDLPHKTIHLRFLVNFSCKAPVDSVFQTQKKM